MRLSTFAVRIMILLCLLSILTIPSTGYADDTWRGEFENVCSKTANAMALSAEDLQELIKTCDQLKGVIEQQDETTRKVYLKRLQMCQSFYRYVLGEKNRDKAEK